MTNADTATLRNRQWLLAERPSAMVSPDHFTLRDSVLDASALRPGEIIVKNLYALCAPSQRNWMREKADHHPFIDVGDCVSGPTASQIIQSAHPDFPVGRCGFTLSGWQDYDRLDMESGAVMTLYPEGLDPLDGLGVFGINASTAWIGITQLADIRPGATMLVSGAAGSVGSAAVQIGRNLGARVVGLAGDDEKCAWLRSACGAEEAINYRTETLDARLTELFPNGIDIFFDNVGGAVLSTALTHMAAMGRVVMCGQIAGYNTHEPVLTSDHMTLMVYRSVSIHAYNLNHYLHHLDDAVAGLRSWEAQGLYVHREDVRIGLETLPQTYAELFTGANKGTLLVKISAPDTDPLS